MIRVCCEVVLVVEDLDSDSIPESVWPLVTFDGLNHGEAITSVHIYASRDTHVYRWSWDIQSRTVTGERETVINNMNADGNGGAPQGHTTRTLVFDPNNDTILYVSVGSGDNIDPNSFRARIRRFSIHNELAFPLDFMVGEVFADGLRNEVGMEFDSYGVLWVVDNSANELERSDFGGVIYNDNPAEELHRFATAKQNYGYPYCWREYELEAGNKPRGTPWAWPTFLESGQITDDQCRSDEYSVVALAMQAHSAPLGLTFYKYKTNRPAACSGVDPFPVEMDGNLFIAFHGSWNRDIPTGYKVVRVPITSDGTGVVGGNTADPIDFLKHNSELAKWDDGFRPVDVAFDECGRLLVSSDGSRDVNDFGGSKVVRIEYHQGNYKNAADET